MSDERFARQYRFGLPSGFATQILAHMLDSLVRVSRRVGTLHDPDLGPLLITKRQHAQHNSITMDPIAPYTQPPRSHKAVVSSLQSTP